MNTEKFESKEKYRKLIIQKTEYNEVANRTFESRG